MSTSELFLIKESLHLLAEKVQSEGDTFGDFETIANLERNLTIAYYERINA